MAPPLNLLRWCRGIDGLSHAHVNKSSGRSDMAQFAQADKLLSPLIAYEHCKRSAAHLATGNPCASRSSPPPARRPREQVQQQAAIRMCHCVAAKHKTMFMQCNPATHETLQGRHIPQATVFRESGHMRGVGGATALVCVLTEIKRKVFCVPPKSLHICIQTPLVGVRDPTQLGDKPRIRLE